MKMPAGKYWIGDLCYVLDDVWGEVLYELTFTSGAEDQTLTLKDGRTFWLHSTAYGDGSYTTSTPGVGLARTGTSGCILLDSIEDKDEGSLALGHIVEFDEPFTPSYASGIFQFVYTEYDDGDSSVW